jgi:glycosyltransferase involved in cell wall biosynthesis
VRNQTAIKVMIVSTEYPPMQGGIGRYTYNLVKSLRANNVETFVVSNSDGLSDYTGLSPSSKNNSEILLKITEELKPDIVHIQHEHALYNFKIDPLFPFRTKTGLDKFYAFSNIPIVTTFHTSFNFNTWMDSILIEGTEDKLRLRFLYEYWGHLINYSSFLRINNFAKSKSSKSIVFSNYMRNLMPGCEVVYHGSEPYNSIEIEQKEARKRLSLPENVRILLAHGFLTATKGWDVIRNLELPEGWKMVVNHSKNHYNRQIINLNLKNKNIIYLEKDYLSEEELSLLFFASDIVFLPYKAASGSGIMFDGFGHGKPFLASDLEFFKEFSDLKLGLTVKRNSRSFIQGLKIIDKNYEEFQSNVKEFRKNLKWDNIAKKHIQIYENIPTLKNIELLAEKKTKIQK